MFPWTRPCGSWKRHGHEVEGSVEVQRGGTALARVIKHYTLAPEPPKSPRFDLDLSITVQNLTQTPMRIILVQQGPVGFRRDDPSADDRVVLNAMWKGSQVSAKWHTRSTIAKKSTLDLGGDKEEERVAWAAEINRFFTCIMTPAGRESAQDEARFAGLEAVDAAESAEPSTVPEFTALTFQYVTTPRDIAPGGSEKVAFNCYIGPKSKSAFQSVDSYAKLDYYAVMRSGFSSCTPNALVSVMMGLLWLFHSIPPHNYGIAIIMLVLLVRGILHPITKKSQVNMMRMQKQMSGIQPKLEAVKKKYPNDKMQYNQEMMKVYQEAGINPAGQPPELSAHDAAGSDLDRAVHGPGLDDRDAARRTGWPLDQGPDRARRGG